MSWEWNSLQWKRLLAFFVLVAISTFLMVHYYRNTQLNTATDLWKHGSSSTHLNDATSVTDLMELHSTASLPDTDKSSLGDGFGPVPFDMNGSDVLVFLHIQKTGGTTFGRQLVGNLILPKECNILYNKKRKSCLRPNSDTETWLFSRYSTGWACGLHSDWTELNECVDDKLNKLEGKKERKYFYVTILRDPVKRYLSEWSHVKRGATWKATKFSCNHRENDVPPCYDGDTWSGVSLEEFLSCPNNMASNRQTRMLANLSLVNCYERWLSKNWTLSQVKEMERTILQSAMENLKKMTFFGLVEMQRKMQVLFEYTFPYKFKEDFFQYNSTHVSLTSVSEKDIELIKEKNQMDIELYDFAKQLFDSRFRRFIKEKKR